jgi:hypothetical protein
MAEAIRRECDPLMFSFGFRHPKNWTWERWGTSRRNVYLRWRDGDYDEVTLMWGRFGKPWFRMHYFISRLTPPHPSDALVRRIGGGIMHAWERGRFLPFSKDKFGPWRSIEDVAAITKQCLIEINHFMVDERVGAHIWVAPHWRRVGPGEHGYSTLKYEGNPMLDDERDGDFVHPSDAVS